jgi:pilus assembly protein CpaB
MGRRTLLLLAALVVAALGTTGVFLYVNGIDQRAEAQYKVVQVLVATSPIATGTTAQAAQDDAALELRPFLARSVEGSGALSDISEIATKIALAPIAAGQPILTGQFGDSGEATNALPIPDGKLAVSVQLDDPARVAGFVGPGSRVAVFLTSAETNGAGAGEESTRVLLPMVQVIAAGATTLAPTTAENGSQAEQLPKAILTLAVDQTEAQKIVYGSQHGQIYFALLADKSTVNESDAATTARNLFD